MMSIDDKAYRRLAEFCAKLPDFPQDIAQARAEALHALECFEARSAQLRMQVNTATSSETLSILRCEIDAFDAARSSIEKFWLARFDSPLRPASQIHMNSAEGATAEYGSRH